MLLWADVVFGLVMNQKRVLDGHDLGCDGCGPALSLAGLQARHAAGVVVMETAQG